MNSNADSETGLLDLERDLPTTVDDVRMLAELRSQVSSWLTVDPAMLDAWWDDTALDRRPVAQAAWPPFSLE